MRVRKRKAAAAIELAIVLPLLLALCVASVDLGRGCHCGIALASAARVGAEYGATRRFDLANSADFEAKVTAAAREEFSSQSGLDASALQVDCEVTNAAGGLHRCRVVVNYPFSTVVDWPSIANPLLMQREATFRRYR